VDVAGIGGADVAVMRWKKIKIVVGLFLLWGVLYVFIGMMDALNDAGYARFCSEQHLVEHHWAKVCPPQPGTEFWWHALTAVGPLGLAVGGVWILRGPHSN